MATIKFIFYSLLSINIYRTNCVFSNEDSKFIVLDPSTNYKEITDENVNINDKDSIFVNCVTDMLTVNDVNIGYALIYCDGETLISQWNQVNVDRIDCLEISVEKTVCKFPDTDSNDKIKYPLLHSGFNYLPNEAVTSVYCDGYEYYLFKVSCVESKYVYTDQNDKEIQNVNNFCSSMNKNCDPSMLPKQLLPTTYTMTFNEHKINVKCFYTGKIYILECSDTNYQYENENLTQKIANSICNSFF
ncbi:hypothetical protein MHBO_001146 [Bonamia ostreae]|uniref:Uncharacterized protein n=1 Tax=Bonamia ostreae TaxID=126728 RepID=A0ABV2AHZ9_9EUKA